MFRFAPSKDDALKSGDSSSNNNNNNNSNNHKNNSDEESLQNLQREWAMLSAEDPLWWTHQQQQEQQQQQQLQQREHVQVQQQWWYYSRQRHPLLSNRGWKGGRRNGGNSNHNNEDDDACWWLTQQGQNPDGDQQQQQQPWYLLCGGENDYDDDAAAAAERSRLDACADSFMRCLLWMGVMVDLIACVVALTWGLYCWIVESVRFESREARNVGILLVVQSCIFLLRCLMVRALLRIPNPSEYSENNNYNNNNNKKGDDAAIMTVGSDTIRGDDDDVTDHCACLCMKPFLYASFFISFFMSVLYICFGLWWFDFGGYDSETSLLRTDWMYDAAEHILRESLLQFLGQRTVVFVLVLTASISELVRLFLLRLFLNELELNMILLRHHGTSTKKHGGGSGETTIVFEDASWFELEPDNNSHNDDTVSDLSRGLLSASWMDEEASYYHQRVASPSPPARATTTTTRNRATTTPTSKSAQGVQGDLHPSKETGLEWESASGDK